MIKIALSLKVFLALLLFIFLNSCSSNSVESDLTLICSTTETINNDVHLSQQEKLNSFAQLTNHPNLSYSTKKFLINLMVKSEVSFEDFNSYAQEHGIENWNCDPLRILIKSD